MATCPVYIAYLHACINVTPLNMYCSCQIKTEQKNKLNSYRVCKMSEKSADVSFDPRYSFYTRKNVTIRSQNKKKNRLFFPSKQLKQSNSFNT